MRTRIARRGGRERGFTLLEVMVGMLLLTALVVLMSQAFMAAISRADETGDHSVGAAWVQGYMDYMRNEGYMATGTWTETAASCAAPEPCLPTAFSSANVQVSSTAFTGLRQIDITLYKVGSGSVFLALTTYVTNLVYP